MLEQLKRYEEAIAAHDKVIQLNSNDSIGFIIKVDIYWALHMNFIIVTNYSLLTNRPSQVQRQLILIQILMSFIANIVIIKYDSFIQFDFQSFQNVLLFTKDWNFFPEKFSLTTFSEQFISHKL